MGALFGYAQLPGADPGLLKTLADAMSRRHGDGVSFATLGSDAGFGCCRLSAAPGEKPPGDGIARSTDGKVFLVADADIINRDELTALCGGQQPGIAELLLALYEKSGPDFALSVRGSFAVAILDRRRNEFLLLKDRLGVKPLFFAQPEGGVLFASDLPALLATGLVPREVSAVAIHHYLTYQYVPYPDTICPGITRVPPASVCRFQGAGVLTRRYWQLDFTKKTTLGYAACRERVAEMVTESMRRMLSDAPSVGCLLSGGIDSTIMLGLLTKLTGKPVPVFSVGFAIDEFNELPVAESTAARYGALMTPLMLQPDSIERLPEIVRAYGEPYADSSALPTYYAMELAAKRARVVFLGDGGDDLFAGYLRYWAVKTAARFDVIPAPLVRALADVFLRVAPATNRSRSLLGYGRRFLDMLRLPVTERYGRLVCHFTNEMKDELYTSDFRHTVAGADSFDFFRGYFNQADRKLDLVDRLLYADLNTYMPGDLVVKVEVAAAANNLIARAPILDPAIIDFAASLPASYKLRGKKTKFILKDAFRDLIPDNVLNRRKTGFGAPIGVWFRKELNGWLRGRLLDSKLPRRGYFRREAIESLLTEHQSGARDHGYRLWNLLMLELWHEEFLDRA